MVGIYYDVLTKGAYVPYNDDEVEPLEMLIDALENAIDEMKQSGDSDTDKYLAGYYLSLANIYIRLDPEYHEDSAELINLAAQIIDNEPEYTENRCYLCMTEAWYYTQVSPDPKRTKDLTEKAEEIATNVFQTDLEIIDIIYISTANCWFYHNDLESAVAKLNEAIEICEKYPDKLPYIDKKCELLRCLLDVFYEIQDMKKCRELIAEIDMINNKYQDQGVSRMISDDIRNSVE